MGKTRSNMVRLAVLLLGMASFGAQASVISEPPDLSNSFVAPTVLAVGTTQVTGTLAAPGEFDGADYFQFTGLLSSSDYILTFSTTTPVFTVDAQAVNLAPPSEGTFTSVSSFSGTFSSTPGGTLDAGVFGFFASGADVNWTVDLSRPEAVSTPATLALAALGLAGIGLRRRRNRRA